MRNVCCMVILMGVAALGLTGCNTFESRAKEHAAVFDALPPEAQVRLRNEDVEVGDTQTMVYIAWGEPDRRSTRKTTTGASELWTYFSYYSQYAGTRVRYQTYYTYDAGSKTYIPYQVPVFYDYYDNRSRIWRQVTFVEGKATEVIQ